MTLSRSAYPSHPAGLYAASADADRGMLPTDQAHGLRRMFQTHTLRFVPVVANTQLLFGGTVLERLCAAWASHGLQTLVVDAGDRARAPCELAEFDLREGIEPLSSHVHFLAARGLPLRHVDARGSSEGFLDALAQAAPQMDVILVHAGAGDIARLFGRAAKRDGAQRLRPLVLTDSNAPAITEAYAAIKVLAQRAGLLAHDLVVCTPPQGALPGQIAQRLAHCAENFLGAAQRGWAALDPAQSPTEAPAPAFSRLATELLDSALACLTSEAQLDTLARPGAALPARYAPVLN